MNCREAAALLDTFVDGELPPDQTLAIEAHLGSCAECGERLQFENAFRASMKAATHEAPAQSGLEARFAGALRAERERMLAGSTVPPRPKASQRAWVPLLLAAAAAFGAAMLLEAQSSRERKVLRVPEEIGRNVAAVEAPPTPEQALDELVRYHAAPPEPQITEPRLVERLEPEVGVPVRLPALKQYGASWEGGGTVPMNRQRAALFRYRVSNHPVTVYVYDASRVPLRAVLEPRVVHNQPVHVGARHGYSIAAVEQRGVGYAVATDLNDDESAEIVTTMY